MKDVDYSDEAIEMRIRQVAQLRNLCLSLAKSNPANAQRPAPHSPRNSEEPEEPEELQ